MTRKEWKRVERLRRRRPEIFFFWVGLIVFGIALALAVAYSVL